jgi:hypothetical protein
MLVRLPEIMGKIPQEIEAVGQGNKLVDPIGRRKGLLEVRRSEMERLAECGCSRTT